MNDYESVSKALAGGAEPRLLCATCPWDRYCITPPTMTRADIDARMKEAEQIDARPDKDGKEKMPIGSLLTAVMFAGRDTSAQVCPVFALRLKSSGGRAIADEVKARMQGWDDQS